MEKQEIKYCPKCGEPLVEGKSFCPGCGFDINSAFQAIPKKPEQAKTAPQNEKIDYEKYKTPAIVYSAITAALYIVAAFMFALFLHSINGGGLDIIIFFVLFVGAFVPMLLLFTHALDNVDLHIYSQKVKKARANKQKVPDTKIGAGKKITIVIVFGLGSLFVILPALGFALSALL